MSIQWRKERGEGEEGERERERETVEMLVKYVL
jgi:hypothetical protein